MHSHSYSYGFREQFGAGHGVREYKLNFLAIKPNAMKAQHFLKHLKGDYLPQSGDVIKLSSRTYKLKIRFNGLKKSPRF